jgi:hypothetical protein
MPIADTQYLFEKGTFNQLERSFAKYNLNIYINFSDLFKITFVDIVYKLVSKFVLTLSVLWYKVKAFIVSTGGQRACDEVKMDSYEV